MPRDEDDAILSLEGFALEGLLTDLHPEAFSGLRGQLGLSHANIGYGREDLYNGKFADDDPDIPSNQADENSRIARSSLFGSGSGRDWEDEVDKEFQEDKDRLVYGGRAPINKVRGEIDDYDDDDDEEEEESLAADSPQMYRKDPSNRQGLPNIHSSSTATSSSPGPTTISPMLPKPLRPEQVDLETLFPSFIPHTVLEFTELFSTLPRKRQKTSSGYVNIRYPQPPQQHISTIKYLDGTVSIPVSKTSHQSKFPQLLEEAYRDLIHKLPPEIPVAYDTMETDGKGDTSDHELEAITQANTSRGATPWKLPTDERGWEALTMADWEDGIVWQPEVSQSNSSARPLDTLTRLTRPRNRAIEEGDWLRSVIWDAKNGTWKDFTGLELLPQDVEKDPQPPDPLATVIDSSLSPQKQSSTAKGNRPQSLDPFNLSNDRLYEVSKEQRRRVRQTFGNLEVQHSYPALKLHFPLYKTRLTKHEARSFHRPALQFPLNIPIKFSRVKIAKKKKDKTGRKIRNTAVASELLKTTADLTLKDTGAFMLFEYSEEAPPVISNVGMGSILVNYYRKKNANDEYVPKDDLGEPFVLDVADASPFMKFGSIPPGETVPTLYNNLVRAPLFKHKANETDFLVIKSVTETETNYYIRAIENVFVIGQTFPAVEVPGPHSRKITNLTKLRLHNIAQRLTERSTDSRLKIQTLMKYFNDQNELQMRQRLKEFMEYVRRGQNQGYWTMRSNFKLPEDLLKLSTPEWVCLAESMQVGQRQLLDAGYGKDADAEGDGEDQSKLDIEQQLAPWSTTKNFLQAAQSKAMLRLYGEGDPSGRGEAFSFIKVSMKEVFLRYGETMEDRQAEIAARPKSTHKNSHNEQQDVYQQEIERIWHSQRIALSNPIPPQLTQEDELRARGRHPHSISHQHHHHHGPDTPWSAGVGTPVDWSNSRRSRSPSSFSRQSSPERDDGMSMGSRHNVVGANKALKIRRLIDGKWRTEVVRDPTIVNAYLRQRRLIDEQESSTEALMPSDDPEKNRMAKKRIEEVLAKLKRNQERRLARKNAKEAQALLTSSTITKRPSIIPAVTPTIQYPEGSRGPVRKCGNCGQVGHMKTNRKCSRWHEFYGVIGGSGTQTGDE
ncbi:uncharacterized protein MELLADRAFT_118533 [Melampsora larici-populina 98AG31]|uniref:Transcription initiation factor TFIID subunit 1 histone acetyltransferase domain-containing protein n=1 Tax=Melampsora larici-populina (strain 98AG31 / pathotype 3-4-7) TaxID=747676 RepID=F4SA93_MELLP|nr:uncharacterized protein MELLADRAFT_118533 [Melampsora larici-populina 98AG31]EGF98411.1 hypothetical protein MELLADRAFT_118533 [Melampsora larici-populina 98AG31]